MRPLPSGMSCARTREPPASGRPRKSVPIYDRATIYVARSSRACARLDRGRKISAASFQTRRASTFAVTLPPLERGNRTRRSPGRDAAGETALEARVPRVIRLIPCAFPSRGQAAGQKGSPVRQRGEGGEGDGKHRGVCTPLPTRRMPADLSRRLRRWRRFIINYN
jgi:hypothetical protein